MVITGSPLLTNPSLNCSYLGDKEWLSTEQEQELIQKVEEEREKVIPFCCDLLCPLHLNRAQFRHVAKHGHCSLVDRQGEGVM